MEFTLRGRRLSIDPDDVRAAVRDVDPEAIRTHSVVIEGVAYPVKQPVALATGMDRLDITTNDARRVLRALGFQPTRVKPGTAR